VNEEKGAGDNIGTEWVAADRLQFTLGYYESNGGLLREHAGRPNSKGRCGHHVLLRRGLSTGRGVWWVVSEAGMSYC
jgi:hypothetical protein